MIRSKFIFLFAFALAMVAGFVAGRLSTRLPMVAASSGKTRSWLADQLNLTSGQRQQMDAIWVVAGPRMDQLFEQRRAFDRERDQAIQDMLGPEQWAAYGRIFDEFRTKRSAVDKERELVLRDAEARSRSLLTDEQKQIWDAMKKSHGHHSSHGGDRSGVAASAATSPSE